MSFGLLYMIAMQFQREREREIYIYIHIYVYDMHIACSIVGKGLF